MLDAQLTADYEGVPGVYLIAFYRNGAHVPYGTGRSARAGALHYLGFSENIGRRLAEHQHGAGARLTRAVCLAGWELRLVRVWPGATRQDERRLKCSHNAARHCPLCWEQITPGSPAPVERSAPAPALFPVPAPAVVLAS